MPALTVGMFLDHPFVGPELVGVAVFSIPAHPAVLSHPLPTLSPLTQSIELGRFCLLGEPGEAGGKALGLHANPQVYPKPDRAAS